MSKIKKIKKPFSKRLVDKLYKFGMFILSIPLVFIYIPIRFLGRKIASFILWVFRTNKYYEGDVGILKFFKYVAIPHPYKGDSNFIMFFELNVTGEKNQAQRNRAFIMFLLPALGSFLLFVVTPFFMGIYYSFTNWTGLNSGSQIIVGFDNYKNIFKDYLFIYSFTRTTIYSILNVIVINVVAFSLALLVTQKLKLKNLYRAGFFMPNLIGGLVLGYIWQFIYSSVFTAIGNNLGAETGLFSHSLIGGFANSSESMGALIAVVTWQYAGYIMMIYIAALQNVPQDLIEASKIDGASGLQRLRTIIFPLVAQAFTIALFLTLVTSFKQYDTIQALTQGGPSALIPEYLSKLLNVPFWSSVNTLDLMAINIYETAFSHYEMGVGQAKAIVFFTILLIVSVIQVTYNQRKEVEL